MLGLSGATGPPLRRAAESRRLLADDDEKKTVAAYKQCGGKNACGKEKGKQCADEEWDGYKCEKDYMCEKQNEWYWQCMPTGNANKPNEDAKKWSEPSKLAADEIGRFQQCGGSSGKCDAYGCMDCAHPGKKCEDGYKCERLSDAYWQCNPEDEVKGDVKYCKAPPKLVKVFDDEDQDYDVSDLVKNQDKVYEEEAEAPAPAEEPEEEAEEEMEVKEEEMGFDEGADITMVLGEVQEEKKCNTPVLEHEIDGTYMGGLFLDGSEDLYAACCGACLAEGGCAGFQVNLFANATNTCEMFSEVLDVVPSTSVTAGVILLPNEVSIAGK
jgi:hypothetical protein